MASPRYRICTQCIMDTSDPFISFDADGVCNHCKIYEELNSKRRFSAEESQHRLSETVAQMKRAGEGHDYDCVVGVSGGVDSSYLLYQSKKLGLRPLAVHFDCGWDSEL